MAFRLFEYCSQTKLAARFALFSHLFIVVEAIGLTTLLTGFGNKGHGFCFALFNGCVRFDVGHLRLSALICCRIRIVE